MAKLPVTGVLDSSAGAGLLNQRMIERRFKAVILVLHLAARHARRQSGRVENRRKVDALGLPMHIGNVGIDPVHAAHHLIDGAEAELGHVLANLFGDEEEEVDHMLGLALEARAQDRVLGGDAHRAGVQVALAHHDAAHGDQRHGGKAELFRAQQRGDNHVAAGLQLAVGLHLDAAAQIVEQQHLLRLGQAQFPGQAGVLDGTERRSAGAAVVAGDEHHVGMRLGDACRNRAHANFRNQLDRDARLRVHVLQVVDQLRQIFDGVNVVMRRRRNQAHTGDGVARLGDRLIHLVAGQLSALAGLCALGHLDLDFVRVD